MPKPKTTFIPRTEVRKGHETVMGTVTKDPEVSPSGKTMTITFKTHAGREFTDRVSTAGKMAVFTGE
jgi:hypothetical protein